MSSRFPSRYLLAAALPTAARAAATSVAPPPAPLYGQQVSVKVVP